RSSGRGYDVPCRAVDRFAFTADAVEVFWHGSPARARFAGLAGMTRFLGSNRYRLATTHSDVPLVSPVSRCASTSSYPGSTGVSMPEPFRFSSGEEHALRRPFTRPCEG